MKKERGKFLTIMIIYSVTSSLFATYGIITGLFENVYSVASLNIPAWYHPFSLVTNLLSFISLYLIWNFKKTGVYLLAGIFTLGFIVYGLVSRSIFGLEDTAGLIGSFIGMILAYGLWFWAIYRKWKYFV